MVGPCMKLYIVYYSFYLCATDTLEIVKILWQRKKCYNIFTWALFLIVNCGWFPLMVYYFILSYNNLLHC